MSTAATPVVNWVLDDISVPYASLTNATFTREGAHPKTIADRFPHRSARDIPEETPGGEGGCPTPAWPQWSRSPRDRRPEPSRWLEKRGGTRRQHTPPPRKPGCRSRSLLVARGGPMIESSAHTTPATIIAALSPMPFTGMPDRMVLAMVAWRTTPGIAPRFGTRGSSPEPEKSPPTMTRRSRKRSGRVRSVASRSFQGTRSKSAGVDGVIDPELLAGSRAASPCLARRGPLRRPAPRTMAATHPHDHR